MVPRAHEAEEARRHGRGLTARATEGAWHSRPHAAGPASRPGCPLGGRPLTPAPVPSLPGRAQLGDGPLLQAVPVEGDTGRGAEGLRRGADHPQVSPALTATPRAATPPTPPFTPGCRPCGGVQDSSQSRHRERAAHGTQAARAAGGGAGARPGWSPSGWRPPRTTAPPGPHQAFRRQLTAPGCPSLSPQQARELE